MRLSIRSLSFVGAGLLAFIAFQAEADDSMVKIAMCQIFCLDGDREGNFVRIEAAVQEAADGRADIVCLPETCILGWVNPTAHDRACEIPGKDSQRLSLLAKKYGVMLCVGLAEKEGDKLFDSVLLFDSHGKTILKHRKINTLAKLMTPPYTKGEEVQTVDTKYGRIGLLICADSFDKSVLDRMSKLDPDLVLIPYGWAAAEEKWPEHGENLAATIRNAAQVTGATVIGTDLVGQISHGPWTGLVYGGQSIAAGPDGTVHGSGKDRQRDIVIVSVN